jgi:hypothetical protein
MSIEIPFVLNELALADYRIDTDWAITHICKADIRIR